VPGVPPPPQPPVATLSISLTVDGAARPPITSATLAALAPDWSDPNHKIWRLARIAGVAASASLTFAVTGARDVTSEMPNESGDKKLVPALLLSQRGTPVAEFIDPAEPFSKFHGEGGRLGRSPDPMPRVQNVTKIDVRHR